MGKPEQTFRMKQDTETKEENKQNKRTREKNSKMTT